MKKKNIDLIAMIPVIALGVGVGMATNYNLIYLAIAGGIGGFISYLLKSALKKHQN